MSHKFSANVQVLVTVDPELLKSDVRDHPGAVLNQFLFHENVFHS